MFWNISVAQAISTHTLTWSVTKHKKHILPCYAISTHTLTWSVTNMFWNISVAQAISTHTLTWSVTDIFARTQSWKPFQLTRSRGAWRQWQILRDSLSHFNSHAHVERDPRRTGKYAESWNFNSHAHVERDAEKDKLCKEFVISTHTLTWSVTEEFESLI